MSDINSEEKNTPIKEFSYLKEAFLPGAMLFFFFPFSLKSQQEINLTREMMLKVPVLPFYLVLLKAVNFNSSKATWGNS